MSEPVLTAMVSTYASERYLAGCLDDLLRQSLGAKLEIVVVDAASPEREGELVRAYQRHAPNLRYVRAETRESTSTAFRRATALARGRYLTTANTDDRHHPEFAARMVEVLERHPGFGLVYADSLITHRDNETWQVHTAKRRYTWPDYTPATALSHCLFGAQAVWRRSVHATVGDWDEAHPFANDHDLFLRIARRFGAVHLQEALGLFLMRADSQSGVGNRAATLADVLAVLQKHRRSWALDEVFPPLREHDEPFARAAAWVEFGNLSALGPYTDAEFALQCYQRAQAEPVTGEPRERVRAAFATNSGNVLACAGALTAARRALGLAGERGAARVNLARIDRAVAAGSVPRLCDLQFVELDHAVVHQSRAARGLVREAGALRWSPVRQQVAWHGFPGADGAPIESAAPNTKVWSLPSPPRPDAARHVLLVLYGWADAGGGTMLPRAFAAQLRRDGCRVSVFYAAVASAPDLPAYGLRRHEEAGVELFGLCNRPSVFADLQHPEREIDDPAVRAVFDGLLDELDPDVVHFWNLHNLGMSLPSACHARGMPTVLSSNNYWALCPRLYLFDEDLRRCDGAGVDGTKCARCVGRPEAAAAHAERRSEGVRMLREDIDVHLAVSTRVRELYLANGDDPDHVRVLRQEPPQVTTIWQRTGSQRAIVDELRRPLRVGFFGSVLPHKGMHVLVEALQRLPEGAAVCVALGDQEPRYLEHLRRLDGHGRVHFHGRYAQEALPELLRPFDVVVVPSVWDDCAPYVVAEALAARCPVIGSRIGGIPDFVDEGRTGWLFPAGDAAALAERLHSFRADAGLLGRMQRAIPAPRGLAAFAGDVLAVYDDLIRAREPAALLPG